MHAATTQPPVCTPICHVCKSCRTRRRIRQRAAMLSGKKSVIQGGNKASVKTLHNERKQPVKRISQGKTRVNLYSGFTISCLLGPISKSLRALKGLSSTTFGYFSHVDLQRFQSTFVRVGPVDFTSYLGVTFHLLASSTLFISGASWTLDILGFPELSGGRGPAVPPHLASAA